MNDFPTALAGILIPLAGTTAGAAAVLFMKRNISDAVQKALLGFAAGVMIAASVFSLLLPAIEMAEEAGAAPWLPASLGFLTGVFFLLGLDALIPHPHLAPSA